MFFIFDWLFFIVPTTFFYACYLFVEDFTNFFEPPSNHFFFLNSVSDKLPSFYLAFFLEISPFLSVVACFFFFFCLPILAAFCVCLYVLGRYAMTPSLCEVALGSRCPVGPSGAVSLIT